MLWTDKEYCEILRTNMVTKIQLSLYKAQICKQKLGRKIFIDYSKQLWKQMEHLMKIIYTLNNI